MMPKLTEAQKQGDPSWLWPAMVAMAISWTLVVFYCGYRAGQQAAIAKSESVRFYVNGEMRNIGFCKWLELSNFANEVTLAAIYGDKYVPPYERGHHD